ncbi:GtrA family protein [Actinacidiphila glaucinigra]|nr:GtrA family protein [Actinacidiphila glaucinigra]MDX2853946.1 GtrA family protein [Streptomyces sp. PA03-3a]
MKVTDQTQTGPNDHMDGAAGLRNRLTAMSREIAKFGAVGGAGVLVNIGVFNLVRHTTDLQVVRAGIIATVAAIAFNYVGFRYFTYRDRDKSGRTRELTLFMVFSAVGLVIENGVLYTATYAFGWDSPLQSNVFKFIGIGVATLFRFWSYRSWVFKALPVREPAVHQAESFLVAKGNETPGARTGTHVS